MIPWSKRLIILIVGAGSAGCVLANRLSEDAGATVKVLEAGPMDKSFYLLRMPAAAWIIINGRKYNWYYHSEPEPYMDGRRIFYPRGKVVGGSSSINGMVYFRGNPLDYDGWSTNQLNNWSYAHCLPYFKRMETSDRGANDYRGGDGPSGRDDRRRPQSALPRLCRGRHASGLSLYRGR